MAKQTKLKQAILNSEFLKSIPQLPGVYLMYDASGAVLYVGKAKELRKRLASYQRFLESRHTKTGVMLSKTKNIETIITTTEKESFILEASLIKKHHPQYNIILRDDKNYPLIKVTIKEKWPRLVMTRRRIRDGSRYFGPYSSSSSMWKTIRYLSKLFPLRRCKGKNIKDRQRPCLNYQMKRCLAPCVQNVSKQDYWQLVDSIILVLEGRNKDLIKILKKKMSEAAADLDFEKAANLRDQIKAIENTTEKQVIVAKHTKDQDVFGLIMQGHSAAFSVLHVRRGVLNGFQNFYLAEPIGSKENIMAEVLGRFYGEPCDIPKEIFLSVMPEGKDSFVNWIKDRKGSLVTVKVPKRGDGLKLLKMAEENADQVFKDHAQKISTWQGTSAALKKTLKLKVHPDRIICLDISNIGGKQSVGAVVKYYMGEKESTGYRHYKIKSVEGPDDYASMRELLQRHLKRAVQEEMLPDLLVVDGGKGQLNMAVAVVSDLKLQDKIELVGIAKEKGEEGEKLYRPGRKNSIVLRMNSSQLLFLMKVRDEAHRFGITFHRKWRNRDTLISVLDNISGVGPSRKASLLKEIGSIQRVKKATVEKLSEVSGINLKLANQIWDYFHST